MATTIHTISAVQVGTAKIGGIQSHDAEHGTTVQGEGASGSIYPMTQSITAQNPTAKFATKDLKTALDALGVLGADLATNNLILICQQMAAGASVAAGSVHRKILAQHGIVVPETISIDHQGDAVLNVAATITYDGTNNPFVLTESQALPTGFVDDEIFTIGPVTLESIVFSQIKHLEINFGLAVKVEGVDSDVWPTIATIMGVNARINIRGIDIDWWKDAGGIAMTGKAITHANTKLFLRKRAKGATYVADATAEHIKFTACGLAVIENGFTGSHGEPGEISAAVSCYHDGTNAPLTVNTAIAIT